MFFNGGKLKYLNSFNLNIFLSYPNPFVVSCMHPVNIGTFPFLLFFLVCQAMLALCADPPYIFAVHHGMKMDILLVVVSQLVEEVQNPLPLLRGHIVEALQPATTGRACFSGIDISSSGVPVFLTGIEGVLFDVSFPPAKKETQLNGFIFIELVESFFIESCFVRLTSW